MWISSFFYQSHIVCILLTLLYTVTKIVMIGDYRRVLVLGLHNAEDVTWTFKTTCLSKRYQQHHFLRLRRSNVSSNITRRYILQRTSGRELATSWSCKTIQHRTHTGVILPSMKDTFLQKRCTVLLNFCMLWHQAHPSDALFVLCIYFVLSTISALCNPIYDCVLCVTDPHNVIKFTKCHW